MSTATLHFVSQNAAGYGPTDGRYLPCIGGSKTALSQIKIVPIRCSSRGMFSVSNSSSGGYRRNPDFSRQNKNGYSRNRIRPNDETNGSDGHEESEFFSSKNGPLLSVSGAPKFQATASPGPREREIVELFRKVQAQLRERAAVKVEKKIEETQGRDKESGTVDSLLKLLRKHTNQPGKRSSSNGGSREFVADHSGQNGAIVDESRTRFVDPDITAKDENHSPPFRRPPSKFERRSPVPQVKYRPIQSESVTREKIYQEPEVLEPELEIEPEIEPEPEPEPVFSNADDVFDRIPHDETSDIDEVFSDEEEQQEEEEEEEEKPIVDEDLSALKLTELRALAKSRGLKGFSKLKKVDLVELLSGGSA